MAFPGLVCFREHGLLTETLTHVSDRGSMACPLGQWSLWVRATPSPSLFTRRPGKEQQGRPGPEMDVLAPGVTQAGGSEATGTGEENPLERRPGLCSSELLPPRASQCLSVLDPTGPGTCFRSVGVMDSLLLRSSVPGRKLGLSVSWDHRVAGRSPGGDRRTYFQLLSEQCPQPVWLGPGSVAPGPLAQTSPGPLAELHWLRGRF